MTKKIALYAGSFDPITNGHYDIVLRAAQIFDEVIVAVMTNTSKNYMFSYEEKEKMINQQFEKLDNVSVVDGENKLTVDLAKELKANVLVRSMRNTNDFIYESGVSQINHLQDNNIETLYLLSDPKYANISSSMIKEIITFGGNVSQLVAPEVEKLLKNKIKGIH
ncbi:phosphopantetheine adenylyltransferase [Companilactobacillus sp. RD055328]|uniref:pantetheine-phosphate adenylyltransferase n=1 Tax=Companilactobacillus sp. RD055328 TaxID=2916634 RepID=UPI001FC84645|nr:pantetheine-phosphate adenylyltransferase [Companilactobacillus sp. RD055328]GKQ42815.1 phosphopantetheine adenylyltransferase [Companilactobacillus sp. RD055328]